LARVTYALRVLASGGGGTSAGNGLIVRLLGIPLRWLGLAVGGLVLAVSGLFGGLDEVADPDVKVVDFNQLVDGSPLNVTIHSVRVADEAMRVKHSEPGGRWIIVEATVENTDNETVGMIVANRSIRIAGVEGIKKPGADSIEEYPDHIILVRDNGLITQVMPSLPIRVGFFWEQPASARVPTNVEVIMVRMTKRQQEGDGQVWWFDDTPFAVLRTPVNYTRNASPSPTVSRPNASGSASPRPSTSARSATPSPSPSRTR
jgi:hypothetical protein